MLLSLKQLDGPKVSDGMPCGVDDIWMIDVVGPSIPTDECKSWLDKLKKNFASHMGIYPLCPPKL
jgi:hypothetical protein